MDRIPLGNELSGTAEEREPAPAERDADPAATRLLFGPPELQFGTAGSDRPDAGDAQRLRSATAPGLALRSAACASAALSAARSASEPLLLRRQVGYALAQARPVPAGLDYEVDQLGPAPPHLA
jgi:hypothetical protein